MSRSRTIGSRPDLVVHGGGNTSVKTEEVDHLGRLRQVLRIKGSGSDLATVTEGDFPGLFLDELGVLARRDRMSDEEMTEFLRHCTVDPGSRRPSIETLLHAWLPARCVDHVHADAVCSLTNGPDAAKAVHEAMGPDVALVPYIRPGFALSKTVASLAGSAAVVLAHHGLVTWGESPEQCLEATFGYVERAEKYLEDRGVQIQHRWSGEAEGPTVLVPDGSWPQPSSSGVEELSPGELESILLELRGAVSKRSRKVLHLEVAGRRFADRPDASDLASAGPATADHVLRIGTAAALLHRDAAGSVTEEVDRFERSYESYWERWHSRVHPAVEMRDPAPAAVLVPGAGLVCCGRNAAEARAASDVAMHTLAVASAAKDAFGAVDLLCEQDLFDIDYWPLELAKVSSRRYGELEGRIVVVSGAATGIGLDIAGHLVSLGAHLVLGDIDASGLAGAVEELQGRGGEVAAVPGDLCDQTVVERLFTEAIRRFGGVDGVVANAGIAAPGELATLSVEQWRRSLDVNLTSHFLLTRQALAALARQGSGGSLVYVASKNAFDPGAGFGAYSVAKAGQVQLARMAAIEGGPIGVRSNVVNPDAVFEGSHLWSEELRASRAAAHGVQPDQLESFYASRSLLGRSVTGHHVAEAVGFLLSDRSDRTTGCVVTVDGGVKGAFPR
ncbi:MAG: bifunctional aldolase/short-chain dehydrogenase [Actinomycetota bacterium]|nr:bifunctional aldolase/short-chain dehydrogenase [Actinomycetota bacterium]